jgi:hypothetical protein
LGGCRKVEEDSGDFVVRIEGVCVAR